MIVPGGLGAKPSAASMASMRAGPDSSRIEGEWNPPGVAPRAASTSRLRPPALDKPTAEVPLPPTLPRPTPAPQPPACPYSPVGVRFSPVDREGCG